MLKRVRVGAVILTVWSAMNLVVALAVTVATLLGKPAPALRLVLDDASLARVDPAVLAVVNAQALFANPCVIALCTLVLCTLWRAVVTGLEWSWWALALALAPLQGFAFASDAWLGHRNLGANLGSTLLVACALVLLRPGRSGAP